MIQDRSKAIAITLIVLLSMSLGTVLIKMIYASISPATFLAMSMLVGIIAMNTYTFLIKKERIPKELITPRIWRYIIEIAICNFVIGTLGMVALNMMSASTNSFVSNFIGLITMGLSVIILKEKPTVWQLVGALVAFIGLRVFFPAIPDRSELLGLILVFISITGVAYTNNIARKLAIESKNQISNNIISTLAITIGGSIAVLIYFIIGGFPPVIPSWREWLVILYSGIMSRAIGLTVWNLILRTLRSYEASILGASSVIWTTLLSYLILGERLTKNQVAGILLLLIGLVLVQIRVKSPARQTPGQLESQP